MSGGGATRGVGRAGPLFWASAVAGWAVIGFGLRGILQHGVDTRPADLAAFVVGGALLHDLVAAPLMILAGVAVARAVPGPARAVVQGALAVTAILALFSFPLVRAYGLAANNPTSLPHNYTANLLAMLGGVWALAAVVLLLRLRSRSGAAARRASRPARPPARSS